MKPCSACRGAVRILDSVFGGNPYLGGEFDAFFNLLGSCDFMGGFGILGDPPRR